MFEYIVVVNKYLRKFINIYLEKLTKNILFWKRFFFSNSLLKNFINLHRNGVFNNFRDIWQNTSCTPNFNGSSFTLSTSTIVDWKKKRKNTKKQKYFFFFRKLHLCQISSKSAIYTSVCPPASDLNVLLPVEYNIRSDLNAPLFYISIQRMKFQRLVRQTIHLEQARKLFNLISRTQNQYRSTLAV